MRIKVKNLGPLKQAEFDLGDLTIICGLNNTGKTYATYAWFGFLSFWREAFEAPVQDKLVNRLMADGSISINVQEYLEYAPKIITDGCRQYAKQLPMVFASAEKLFSSTEFLVDLAPSDIHPMEFYERRVAAPKAELFSIVKSKGSHEIIITLLVAKENVRIPKEVIKGVIGDTIKEVLFGDLFPRPFIASTERTGAAIFRKELNFARNRLLEQMSSKDNEINPLDLLTKVFADYALPVKRNVDFMRQIEGEVKKDSFLGRHHRELLDEFSEIIGGRYLVTKNGELYFIPRSRQIKLTMDESSSAVRSLLDIGFYLRHVAEPGDLLMVDEPELNLHPENQRRVARLFARLINLGVKVFITTHSDYIIKELNTLIMLNRSEPHLERIREEEKYNKEELLNPNRVRVYIAEEGLVMLDEAKRKTRCQTLIPADIDPELGIEARTFDTTIEDMNRIQEAIVFGGEEQE